jgi:hypothetical protein
LGHFDEELLRMSRKLSVKDFAGIASGVAATFYGDLGDPLDAEDWTVISGAGAAVSQIEEDSLLATMTGGTGSQPTVGVLVDVPQMLRDRSPMPAGSRWRAL